MSENETVIGFDEIPEDQEWDTVEQESGQKLEFATPGEGFVGVYVETALIEPENGESFEQQRFRDAQGTLYTINGGFKLRRALSNVKPGSIVRLTYMGEVPMKDQPSPMKDYRVEVAKPKEGGKKPARAQSE